MEERGGEGAAGRCRGCLAAILGRVLGVVMVDVVVDVPAPARRRARAVVVGRVLVDVMGRVRVEVVVTGGMVVVVAGAVPTPATGGRLNRFNASSTLTWYEMLKS